MKKALLGTLALVTGIAVSASASLVDITSEYNVFVDGDFTGILNVGSDVIGKLAAGGDVSIQGYSVGDPGVDAEYKLISGGNLEFLRGTSWSGGIFADGTVDFSNVDVQGNVVANGGVTGYGSVKDGYQIYDGQNIENPVDFSSISAELKSISAQLSEMDGEDIELMYGTNLNVNVTSNEEFAVFHLEGDDLESATNLTIDGLSEDQFAIVNVSGANIATNYMLPNGFTFGNVLFNFYESEELSIHSWNGSILAPHANVTGTNGHMNGNLLAHSFYGNEQFEFHPFQGDIPSVPEPATFSYLLVGALSMVAAYKTRRKK